MYLKLSSALADVAQWTERLTVKQRAAGSIPSQVRAHAWVAGQFRSRGLLSGNHTLMILSFSLPSSLSKSKKIKSLKK